MLSDAQRSSLVAQMSPSNPPPTTSTPSDIPPAIVTRDDFTIRPYHASDAPGCALQANNPAVVTYMTNTFPHPYTEASAHTWFALCAAEDPPLNFAIVDTADGSFMGGIGLKRQFDINERTVELGYWLGETYWGRGLMGRVVRAFVDWVFEQREWVARIEARVMEGNEGSCRVLAKQGFLLEGVNRKQVWKRGRLLDSLMYAVIREDWEKTQATGKPEAS